MVDKCFVMLLVVLVSYSWLVGCRLVVCGRTIIGFIVLVGRSRYLLLLLLLLFFSFLSSLSLSLLLLVVLLVVVVVGCWLLVVGCWCCWLLVLFLCCSKQEEIKNKEEI